MSRAAVAILGCLLFSAVLLAVTSVVAALNPPSPESVVGVVLWLGSVAMFVAAIAFHRSERDR